MRRTIARSRRVGGIFGMLVEVIHEDFRLAGPGLQTSPYPCVPAKHRVAGEVARRFLRSRCFPARISSQKVLGERTVALAHAFNVSVLRTGSPECGAFIGVVADQNRNLVIASGLIQFVLVVGNDPSVGDRPIRADADWQPTISQRECGEARLRSKSPNDWVHATPASSAALRGCMFSPGPPPARTGPNEPPLSEMAASNNPLASGEAQSS